MNIDSIIWACVGFLAGYMVGGVLTAMYIVAQRKEDDRHDLEF